MPLPILTVEQMREWERETWSTGQTEAEVIRRVGAAVGRQAVDLTETGEFILILCGKGNNGADARAAQAHLTSRQVELLEVNDPGADIHRLRPLLSLKPALIIDGLFGIGLNRPLSAEWAALLEMVNASGCAILAVDIPSGLNAATGRPEGAALQATVTLTVGAPKSGLLKPAAWPFVGRLKVASDVGLTACPFRSELEWITPDDVSEFPPRRLAATHKGTYGHLAILAGSLGYHGAAVLTARGAQRARPGLISLYTPQEVYGPVASQLQAVMVHPFHRPINWSEYNALVLGPGLAAFDATPQFREELCGLWASAETPMIVDASALQWLPTNTSSKGIRVITPHPGEAARLLGNTANEVQADRLAALRQLSRKLGNCIVVLKGHQTLIGSAEGQVFVNSTGNPYLAQGGSGDVLAGYLGGFLAQPELQKNPLQTVCYTVWQHGMTADKLQKTQPNWVVEDLVEALGTG